jgi:hypothetical protein
MNEPIPNSTVKNWIDALVPIAFIVTWLAVQAFVLPRFGVRMCCGASCGMPSTPTSQVVPSTDVPSTDPAVPSTNDR